MKDYQIQIKECGRRRCKVAEGYRSVPFPRPGWATGKMGYGEYPAGYNAKVHGPYNPATYYGKGEYTMLAE